MCLQTQLLLPEDHQGAIKGLPQVLHLLLVLQILALQHELVSASCIHWDDRVSDVLTPPGVHRQSTIQGHLQMMNVLLLLLGLVLLLATLQNQQLAPIRMTVMQVSVGCILAIAFLLLASAAPQIFQGLLLLL